MSGGGPWSPPGFDLATPAWGCKGGGCRWPCGPEGFNSGGGWPGMPNRKRNIVVSCGVTGLLWSLHFDRCKLSFAEIYVVVQFCPWFKFYFLLFLGMVIYDNEFETTKNKIQTKDKTEPQHIWLLPKAHALSHFQNYENIQLTLCWWTLG